VKKAAERGYLIGLDGRRLHIRSSHAALNTLLQSAGALICKRWMVEIDNDLKSLGWDDRIKQLAFVHDELQFECPADLAEDFGSLAVAAISKAGGYFGIRVPLTGEYKIGNNWAECH
jgi:DNA polymerase-1